MVENEEFTTRLKRKHPLKATDEFWVDVKVERLKSNHINMNDFLLYVISKGLEVVKSERKKRF